MTVPKWRRDNHEKGNKKGWQDATSAAEKLFKHTLLKTGGKLGREYFSKSDTFTRKLPLLITSRKVFRLCKRANLIYPTTAKQFKKRRKINKERRKLRKQKKLLDTGEITMQDIETSFQCWQAGILQQKCYKQVLQMRRYYWYLFERRAPEWNPQQRRLKMQEMKIISAISEVESQETLINGMLPQ